MILRGLYGACKLIFSVDKAKLYRTSAVLLKSVQFNLSDIGEGIREVTVREWSVEVGDIVAQFDNICSVESDKATVNITSRYDGTITKLYYQVGDVALVGKPLVDIDVKETENANISNLPAEKTQFHESPLIIASPELDMKPVNNIKDFVSEADYQSQFLNKTLATPAVRRIARENNILLSAVSASGKGGRVLKEDILRHIEGKFCETDKMQEEKLITKDSSTNKVQKIGGIRKVMVRTMTKSHAIPTFGYCDEIDVSKLMVLRNNVKELAQLKGVSITFMPFFIKALSKALTQYPILNASVDESCENIIFKSSHNIGVAMDTKEGLIVPNIKNVENLTIYEIAIELKRISEAGRELKLGPLDMTGGTITISNIGIIGGTYVRPLILPPEVCIVGLGKTRLMPTISENGDVSKAYQTTASWTADHRIIDGATLARFSNLWKEYLENPNYLLIDL